MSVHCTLKGRLFIYIYIYDTTLVRVYLYIHDMQEALKGNVKSLCAETKEEKAIEIRERYIYIKHTNIWVNLTKTSSGCISHTFFPKFSLPFSAFFLLNIYYTIHHFKF